MRSSPLVLLLLIGVQAVLNMEGGQALTTRAPNHKTGQQTAANHRAGQQQTAAGDHLSRCHSSQDHQRTSPHRTRRSPRASPQAAESSPVAGDSDSPADPSIPEVDPKLFSKRRYHSSPRVIFSEAPPSRDAPEGEPGDIRGTNGARVRRRAGLQPMHRGEYSICDSINTWVDNLTRATDIAGNEVTVLPNVKINNVVKKQIFYETTCLSATHGRRGTAAGAGGGGGGAGGGKGGGRADKKSGNLGCRGIDNRRWNSYCTNTHTYVRALTTFDNKMAWRHIRINAACVCVLSRKSWGGRLGR
ncbi:nerve growth factor-like [Lampris incognitus]|uniref:nerve growth factor-like n=1 Tax=Lampris incognitus TaxID=2546036 RepID=UPI0024B4C6E1|nr:nerve growth factor-like [Lampris incognitus]